MNFLNSILALSCFLMAKIIVICLSEWMHPLCRITFLSFQMWYTVALSPSLQVITFKLLPFQLFPAQVASSLLMPTNCTNASSCNTFHTCWIQQKSIIHLGSYVTEPLSSTLGRSSTVRSACPSCFFNWDTWNTECNHDYCSNFKR